MLDPVWQHLRSQHYITTTIKLWQYWLQKLHQSQSTLGSSTVFSVALKKTWSILFLPLTPTVSWPIDVVWYSFTFISAAYEPDMIYAVPLTSLSPSSILSALTPFSSLLCPSFLLLFLLLCFLPYSMISLSQCNSPLSSPPHPPALALSLLSAELAVQWG